MRTIFYWDRGGQKTSNDQDGEENSLECGKKTSYVKNLPDGWQHFGESSRRMKTTYEDWTGS